MLVNLTQTVIFKKDFQEEIVQDTSQVNHIMENIIFSD